MPVFDLQSVPTMSENDRHNERAIDRFLVRYYEAAETAGEFPDPDDHEPEDEDDDDELLDEPEEYFND